MKRFLITLMFLLCSVAIISFVSCAGGDTTETNFSSTTRLTAPQLKVEAWPGANVLTWDFVPDAANYKVYRLLNNEWVCLTPTALTVVQYVDTDLIGEIDYVYKVVADTNIETEVSITASYAIQSCRSLKKPAEGTTFSALETTTPEAYKFIAKNITYTTKGATPFSTGNLVVTFPVKAYASYTVSLGGQGVSSVPGATADVSVTYKSYANNVLAQVTITPVSGGTKELYITATPYYTGYDSETVIKPVTIDMMNVGTTTGLAAAWETENTAKVQFTPAAYTDTGKYLATTEYAIYRAEAVTTGSATTYGTYTKLTRTMTEGTLANGNKVYQFTDTGLVKTLSYSYIVVPYKNDGTKDVYGTPVTVLLNAAKASDLAKITATITSIAAKTTTETVGTTTTTTTDPNTAVIKFGVSGGTTKSMKYVTYVSEALAKMATTEELDAGTVIDISAVTDGTVEQKIQSGVFYVICITNTDGATTIRDAWLVSTTDGKTLTAAKL